MRIQLDRDACIGSATCVGFIPTVVKIDKDGHATLLAEDTDGVDGAALAEAVANCPVEAIRLIDAD